MPGPTIAEIDEHLMEEGLKDKKYFPPSGLTIPPPNKYFNIDEWLDFRRKELDKSLDTPDQIVVSQEGYEEIKSKLEDK